MCCEKIKIKPIKSAKDLPQTNTLICPENIHVVKGNTLTKILISSKYKSLLNSDTWGNYVLPELSNSLHIVVSNIREINYLDIQKEHSSLPL